MINVLVVGDEEKAPYHPLSAFQEFIESLDLQEHVFRFTTDYSLMETLDTDKYDIFLAHTDCWKEEGAVSTKAAAAILRFTAAGGLSFIFHTGFSLQQKPELSQMMGAFFTGHPPYTELPFRVPENPLIGFHDFSLSDEPYLFTMSNLVKCEVLLEYQWEGQWIPAGWHRDFGKGKVVYFMPGHDRKTLQNPDFRELFLQFWGAFCGSNALKP